MTISAQHIVAFTRLRVSAPSLLCWAALRGGLARLLPALLALWARLPALLQFVSVPALEHDSCSKEPSEGRAAGEDEDGKVVCELLYSPPPGQWEVDVIFIHGLHGSTVKTWRQGDWNSKYRDVQKVPLRNHSSSSVTDEKIDICPNCHMLKKKPTRVSSVPNGICEIDQNIQNSVDESNTRINNNSTHTSRNKIKLNKMQGIHEELEELSDSEDDILYFNVDEKRKDSLKHSFKINNLVVNSVQEINGKLLPNNNQSVLATSQQQINTNLELVKSLECIHVNGHDSLSNNYMKNTKSDSLTENIDDSLTESITDNLPTGNKLHIDDDVNEPIEDSMKKTSITIGDGISVGKNCDQIMSTTCDISNNSSDIDERAIFSANCDNKGSCDICATNYFGHCLKLQELIKVNDKQMLVNDLIEGKIRDEFAPIAVDKINDVGCNDSNRKLKELDACRYEDNIQISGPMKRTHHFAKFCNISAGSRNECIEKSSCKVRKINANNNMIIHESQYEEYMDLNDDFNEFFNNNVQYEQFLIDHYNSIVESDCKSKTKNDDLEQFRYEFLKGIQYNNNDDFSSIPDEKIIKSSVSEPNLMNNRSKNEEVDLNLKESDDNCNFEKQKHPAEDLNVPRYKNYYCTCDGANKADGCERGDAQVEELLSSCWPRDWIPLDYPGARVISLTYTTDQHLWRPIWIKHYNRTSLEQRSKDMISQLDSIDAGTKPIIWVGHSKGGLFIKEMFSDGYECWSKDGPESAGARIYLNTRAVVFYSVPHRGSPLANITLPPLLRVSSELEEIQHESEFVLKLHERFLGALRGGKASPLILSYSETRRTLMGAFYLRIVSLQSADPGVGNMYGVSLDHREICKPTSRSCFLYKELLGVIRDIRNSQCI